MRLLRRMFLASFAVSLVFLVDPASARYEMEDEEDLKEFTFQSDCSNDLCIPDGDYIEYIVEFVMFPTLIEWMVIFLHFFIFLWGLTGNAIVCLAVWRNKSMRTGTNLSIVNLAVADLLIIVISLPPDVVGEITKTWFLGGNLCKIIRYIQAVSLSVSILTLTFISMERCYAITCPMRAKLGSKSPTGPAKIAIPIIWMVSLVSEIPYLMVLQTVASPLRVKTILYTQCMPSWSEHNVLTLKISRIILLYAAPLTLIAISYGQIVRILWRSNIPGTDSSNNKSGNLDIQLKSRREAAKMLIAVVIMFAICYFPFRLIVVLSVAVGLPGNQMILAVDSFTYCLIHAHSSVNPIIYNFMSKEFHKEFRYVFCCGRPARKRVASNSRNKNTEKKNTSSNKKFINVV